MVAKKTDRGLDLGLDRYTCSACGRVTLDKPHKMAVKCAHCGIFDLGTQIALERWQTVLEAREKARRAAEDPVASSRSGLIVLVLAMLAALALVAVAIWGAR